MTCSACLENVVITDFCTGRQIQIGKLREMIQFAIEAKEFHMHKWINECGTAGCLVGTYCLNKDLRNLLPDEFDYSSPPDYASKLDYFLYWINKEFGLSDKEKGFIFYSHRNFKDHKWFCNHFHAMEASRLDKQQAVARLRKFIEWKIRKSQLLQQYEVARHQEGNWNLVLEVLNLIAG